MFGQANPGATFATDVFAPFNAIDTGGISAGAAQGAGDVQIPSGVAVDQFGNLIPGPVQQRIDPLTGQVINEPAAPAPPQTGFLAGIESAFGGAANFTITVLILIATIVIVPKLIKN